MNVLVIPEDSRKDKDLLKPLIEAMMVELGKPRARVRVCEKPVLGGVGEALKWERIFESLDRYVTDLFLLIVDRDGERNSGRRETLTGIEARCAAVLGEGQALLGEHAIEEAEVWVLAGHDLPQGWAWRDIRAHLNPKEAYFSTFLTAHRGLSDDAAGRSILARQAASNFRRICSRCPEDVGRRMNRVRMRI